MMGTKIHIYRSDGRLMFQKSTVANPMSFLHYFYNEYFLNIFSLERPHLLVNGVYSH